MRLEEGHIYSTSEMQQFFGVSKDSWKKKKDTLLLHFSAYYQYEVRYNENDRRKIDYHIIKELKDYEPPKSKKVQQNEIYSKKILEVIERDRFQTPKNISRIIKDDKEIVALNHAEGTIYEYTRVNTRTMFGKEIMQGGTKGVIFQKIWCKVDIKHNIYIPLDDERIQYLYDTFHSYQKESEQDRLSICADYDSGLITYKEMRQIVADDGLGCFLAAKADFRARYGFNPIKVPEYVISAFDDNE